MCDEIMHAIRKKDCVSMVWSVWSCKNASECSNVTVLDQFVIKGYAPENRDNSVTSELARKF